MNKREIAEKAKEDLEALWNIKPTESWEMSTAHSDAIFYHNSWSKGYTFVGQICTIKHKRMVTAEISISYYEDGELMVSMPLHGKSQLSRWWRMISKNGRYVRCQNINDVVDVVQQIIDMSEMIYGGKNAQN
jgi:hypothetical protein